MIFKKVILLVPPSEGGWGKNFKFKFCPKCSFLIFRKSQEVAIQEVKLLRSNNRSPKTVALSAPLPGKIGLIDDCFDLLLKQSAALMKNLDNWLQV